MSDRQPSLDPALSEAAAWFARLNQRTVTHASLAAFRAWRASPENARAYAEVEALWGETGALGADADIRRAVAGITRRPSLMERLRRAWSTLLGRPVAGLGAALAIAVIALLGSQAMVGKSYETAVGEQRFLRLADGSHLRLDTNSKIRVDFSRGARRIDLVRGQALFEVAHDATRPFIVSADGVSVRALGTRFGVRRLGSGASVTLLEGRVEVRSRREGEARVWALRPGEQVITGPRAARPRTVDVATATSWTRGQLVFRDVPLSAAVDEVNRYSARPIELRSPALAQTRVSGVFDSDDTEAFLAAVTALHPLRRETAPDGAVILRDASGG